MLKSRTRSVAKALRSRKNKLRQGLPLREWAMLFVTGIGSIAAVVGIAAWLSEAPDRQWEREVRRATLAQAAREVLHVESGTLEPSFAVQRAIFTLHELNEPIEISAPRANLAGLILPCGAYRISADEVYFNMTMVYRSYILIRSPVIVINGSQFRHSEIITRSNDRDDNTKPPVSIFSSRALNSHFMFDDGVAIGASTFEASRIKSWFGEVDLVQVNILAPLAFPSFNKIAWQEDAYIDFFDGAELMQAKEDAKFFPRLSSTVYDAGRYLTEQRASAQDVSVNIADISEEWRRFCSVEKDYIQCERSEPRIFEIDKLPDDISPCSIRNEYIDFDPKRFGDEPVFLRTKMLP